MRMIRLFAMTLFASMLSLSLMAAPDWTVKVLELKELYSKAAVSSVTAEVLRVGEQPQKISVDLNGEKYLTLLVTDAGDGDNYDQVAWGDAHFVKANGEKVYLDDMSFKANASAYGVRRGDNYSGKKISIAGKKYEKGITAHSTTSIVIPLDEPYVRFVSEVGIEDGGTKQSSAQIMIIRGDLSKEVAKAVEQYPQIAKFITYSSYSAEQWLANKTGDVERKALLSLIPKLEDGMDFTNLYKLVDGDDAMRTRKYLYLYERVCEVYDLQNELALINLKAIRAAHEDMSKMKGYDAAGNSRKLAELESIVRSGLIAICNYDANKLAQARRAIELKREILLSNPLLDVDRIVASRYDLGMSARTANAPAIGTEPNNWTNILSASRISNPNAIVELNNIDTKPTEKVIYQPANGVPATHLRMHWDADRLMFSSLNDRGLWGVFEVPLNGGEPKELVTTDDADLEFFDATYLPGGNISAISNIGYQGVPCVDGYDPVGNMVIYNPEKSSLRRVTYDQDANWNPVVMNNGRLMFIRWEYADLTHYFSRIVMHMNPDGTEARALYGSNKFFPNAVYDVQPLPGNGSRFVGIVSGHHGVARSGRLMIFDPAKGRTSVEGIVQELPFKDKIIQPLVKDELVNGVWPQFLKPYPVNEDYFLVAGKLSPKGLWGIYLVDVYDNMTLIKEGEGEGYNTPILVEKRPTPPVIPDRVNLDSKESTIFIQDIYEGPGLVDVPRGTIKELRLFSYEYAYIKSPSNNSAQGIQSGWDIKRLLGTVKVEEDGSATFKIPANTPISIQPLDSEGRAVQWMRSWVTGMPGEVVSCVGCHENQNSIPIPKRTIASTKTPMPITPPEGGPHAVSFNAEIQPILDRACISCHNENSKLNFTGNRIDKPTGFNMSYLAFHPFVSRQGSEADAKIMVPYEYHANTSEVVQLLKLGHHGVELTDKEWRNLYTWIDMNAPDKGAFTQNDLNGYNQIERRMELAKKYNNIEVDWQKEARDFMAYIEAKDIQPEAPKKVEAPVYKAAKAGGWPFSAEKAAKMQAGSERRVIEIAPGVEMAFVKIPAGKFVMGSNKAGKDMAPETAVTIGKSYWISETEVTNGQYITIDPDHDSRIVAQMWKDHTNAGYVANRPEQPVTRVSWEEAMEYCQKLSEKMGVKFNLPTEAQWEWAAAAGSDQEFWFGDRSTDFSGYDNMADWQLTKMAVAGVDPQPMSPNSFWYKYYNFMPKVESVNDGQMIITEVGTWYKPNPWGLYDVHGNVAEWTRSDYVPYPYVDQEPQAEALKVARGGSWRDRPKTATRFVRKSYMPWQKVNNVGFRIIIEE